VTDRTGKVVIVGSGPAGEATAVALRKHGFEGDVTLFGSDHRRPYERPYLSKQFLRGEVGEEKVYLRPEDEYARQGIDLRLGVTVVDGDRERREVVLDTGEVFGWDTLVLATGSTPRWLPGAPNVSNTFALRTLDDAESLRAAVESANRILLVGAGFIGAEIAASARLMGKDVLMVEVAEVPLERAIGHDMGRWYSNLHSSRGVDLRLTTSVARWVTDDLRVVAVELSDGKREEVDAVVVAVGVSPNVDLAKTLGLDVGPNGVAVGEDLRAAPNIFAVGDIAAHHHPVYQRGIRVEHWQVAQRQGTAAGRAIAGEPEPYHELPWFWSDQYDVNLQYVGHAKDFDQTIMRGDTDGDKFSAFYLRDGTIDAVLSVNDGRTGRFSRELISSRTKVPEAVLADPDSDLRELAKSKT
jgi:3-phenylpropionate/trans-cinnamate dioxygenase ferredoxin reductase subunit